MADTVKQIGIKQQDGTYSMKDIEVDYSNVAGLSTQATSAKAVGDKNNKDITTYVASGSHSGSNLVLTDGAGNTSNVDLGMTGATSNANGEAGFVPQPTSADLGKFLSADGTWDTPPGEQYVGSSNISIDSNTNAIDLTNTTVSSGTYGPSADVTGTNGTTISVPNISVDAKGRITNITNKTYTSVDTGSKVFTGSLSEWNQLSTAEKKTYDFISNDEPGGTGDEFPANRISYDNTVSGLTANDAQEAIDELSSAENIAYDNTNSGLTATDVQEAVDELKSLTNLINYKTRPCLFVGDSYSASNNSFVNRAITILGLVNAHNISVSGTGFLNGNGFLTQITNYTGNRDEILDIYVIGGLNDSTNQMKSNPSLLESAMGNFVTYAHNNYPNAKLYLSYIGNGKDNSSLISDRVSENREYCKYYYNSTGTQKGFTYFDMSYVLSTNISNIASDGVHPSEYGHIALANALSQYISGGSIKVFYPKYICGFNINTNNVSNIVTGNLTYSVCEDNTYIYFSTDFGIKFIADKTMSNQLIEIGSLAQIYFNRPYTFTVLARIDHANGKQYDDMYLRIVFNEDKVYYSSDTMNSSNSDFETYQPTSAGSSITIFLKGAPVFIVRTADIN